MKEARERLKFKPRIVELAQVKQTRPDTALNYFLMKSKVEVLPTREFSHPSDQKGLRMLRQYLLASTQGWVASSTFFSSWWKYDHTAVHIFNQHKATGCWRREATILLFLLFHQLFTFKSIFQQLLISKAFHQRFLLKAIYQLFLLKAFFKNSYF